jgi:hypothetical protein
LILLLGPTFGAGRALEFGGVFSYAFDGGWISAAFFDHLLTEHQGVARF